MGWAEYDVGGPSLAVEQLDPEDPEGAALVGRFAGVSLEVADIHAAYADLLAKGVEFVSPPTLQPWGGTLAHFKDPDDNVLTLLGAQIDSATENTSH
jgi:predicted enzyme related to lactoylglutathione lyase